MTALTRHTEPSPAQIAAALEQFEIQQLKDQLRQQRIAHTEELSAAKRQAEQEPLERMIERWNGYPAAIQRAEKAEAAEAKARAEHALVTESLTTAIENAEKYQQLAEHYQRQCEQMLDKTNANVDKAKETIERLQEQIRSLNAQIRIYREMNPDKMKKQVKRLQDKNKDLTARNETAVRSAEQLKKDKAALARELEATRQMNRDLQDSLDDMTAIAEGNADPDQYKWAYKDDIWGITGHDRNTRDWIFIEHLPTGQRRVLTHQTGDVMRTEPIPADIKAIAQQWVEKYHKLQEAIDTLSAPARTEQDAS